jgi:hypothetical protein
MNHAFLYTIAVTALGAATVCGCASRPQTSPVAATVTPPTATTTRLPQDPMIDAYVGAMRADLSDGKIQIIGRVMSLSNDEAKVFWPIYQEYESELFELGDQRVELIRRFAATQRAGKLAQREAAELVEGYFKFEQQRLDLLKKYQGAIATALSPTRAAQFTQIEHRVGTIVELSIAAEMPLIQASPGVPSR